MIQTQTRNTNHINIIYTGLNKKVWDKDQSSNPTSCRILEKPLPFPSYKVDHAIKAICLTHMFTFPTGCICTEFSFWQQVQHPEHPTLNGFILMSQSCPILDSVKCCHKRDNCAVYNPDQRLGVTLLWYFPLPHVAKDYAHFKKKIYVI